MQAPFQNSLQPLGYNYDNDEQSTNETTLNYLQPKSNQYNQQWWSSQIPQYQYPQSQLSIKQSLSTKFDSASGIYKQQPNSFSPQMPFQSKSRDGGYRNIPTRDLSSISDQSPQKGDNINEEHPFKKPKLHLFKKDASRRIKTSSATRNLQPIPFENKLINNFNSITAQDNQISESNAYYHQQKSNLIDQENQYAQPRAYKQLHPLSQQQIQLRKINPFSNNHLVANAAGTLDAYQNEDISETFNTKSSQQVRPNTTSLDQLISTTSPKRNKQEDAYSKQNLMQEINGFKHSFYNEKNAHIKSKDALESSRQQQQDQSKEQQQEGVKHIFVLNVNQSSNVQSIQESKAMTPCFLHTPNMTNKWNNFKPTPETDISEGKSNEDRSNIEKLFVENKEIKGFVQSKKPQTSHQSKNQSLNGNKLFRDDQSELLISNSDKKALINLHSNNNNRDIIKIGPQDIYLGSGSGGSKSVGRNNNKPSTASFRRPLSRNHPMLSLVSKQQSQTNKTQQQDKQQQHRIQFSTFKHTNHQQQPSSNGGGGLIREQQLEEEADQ